MQHGARAAAARERDGPGSTNVVFELRKAGDGGRNSSAIARCTDQDAATLFISVLTLMELEIGVLRMERRDPE